jgi:hypothetical protein
MTNLEAVRARFARSMGPPFQEPPRALGATSAEASAQAWGSADATPSHSQAAAESLEILLLIAAQRT